MRIIFTILPLLASILVNAQLHFTEGTWEEVSAKAMAEEKYIFVYYCDDSFLFCVQTMEELNTRQVSSLYNDKFINYWINDPEQVPDLGGPNTIVVRPTMLIYDPEGELVSKWERAPTGDELIQYAERALRAREVIEAYQTNSNDPEILLDFANHLRFEDEDSAAALVNAHLKRVALEDLIQPPYWALVNSYHDDYESDIFQYIWDNRVPFHQAYGKDFEFYVLFPVLQWKMVKKAVAKRDTLLLDHSIDLKYEVMKLAGADTLPRDYFALQTYAHYYDNTLDFPRYFAANDRLVRQYLWGSNEELMNRVTLVAKSAMAVSDNEQYLDHLHEWADQCIALDDQSWRGYMARANLFYAQKNYSESQSAGVLALQFCEEESCSYLEFFVEHLENKLKEE